MLGTDGEQPAEKCHFPFTGLTSAALHSSCGSQCHNPSSRTSRWPAWGCGLEAFRNLSEITARKASSSETNCRGVICAVSSHCCCSKSSYPQKLTADGSGQKQPEGLENHDLSVAAHQLPNTALVCCPFVFL